MVTLSEFVLIGILEAFVVLAIAVIGLLVYNHRLHKRRRSLSTQLRQLKDTTRFLLDKVNDLGNRDYAAFLDEAIHQATASLSEFDVDAKWCFTPDQPPQSKAELLRLRLLTAEKNAAEDANESSQQRLLKVAFASIIAEVEEVTTPAVAVSETKDNSLDEVELKRKWGYLCEAALSLIKQRTFSAEDDMIDIVRSINQDLNLQELDIPNRDELKKGVGKMIEQVKDGADKSQDLIARLLAEKNAAEEKISIKVSELEELQTCLMETKACLSQMESELQAARLAVDSLPSEGAGNEADLETLQQQFDRESGEMRMCIETLEQENAELKSKLNLT